MANSYNAGMNTKIQTMFSAIQAALGSGIAFDLHQSKSARIIIDCPDGQHVTFKLQPLDLGVSAEATIIQASALP